MVYVEIWYKISDILFLLFNYNNYICGQIKHNKKYKTLKQNK